MERENRNLKVLVVILCVMVLGLGGYFFYDKVFSDDCNEIFVDNDIDGITNDQGSKLGHVLNTQVGQFVVSKSGDVYYVNENGKVFEQKIKDVGVLGKYGKYTVSGYYNASSDNGEPIEMPFQGYKLDLENINSAYEVYFGNGGISKSIIFLDNDGKISELRFDIVDSSSSMVRIKKNIEGYNNIVSVVSTSVAMNGTYVILIDSDGNQFEYFGM